VEDCVSCTEGKGVDWDMSHLAVVDGLGSTEEGAVESTLSKAIASVNPDVLIVSTSIYESWKLILRMGLQIV
jgi:hypothetical protein